MMCMIFFFFNQVCIFLGFKTKLGNLFWVKNIHIDDSVILYLSRLLAR